ncbi:SDR family oxidoreductase [Leucobacter chromiireducens]|uniref:SDR family oxidoreductase n=1 Tax=Leucobacter chromiireducens subsp. chromiireducens TaxID=660067 RepID=A0ABS1SVV0_9MICO|nr:SDR family oxidoreductase [Leucobacter chromiireducens]MBL3691041.1 SDR family oxidoreductase [Leucobacter chromiireducens subsp. chromiireducens]
MTPSTDSAAGPTTSGSTTSSPATPAAAVAGPAPGRCALVTGGGRGIGRATARELAARGWAVALFDLDAAALAETAELIRDAGGTAAGYTVDVSDEASVAEGVAAAAAELGAPLVLVNNAGVLRDDFLFRATLDDWDLIMNVHLRGAFLMSRAVQRFMVEAGWGRIVNLSSTSALGNAGQSNYSAAKAGVQGLTKTLALELGKFGITANAVAPGFIATDMTRATAERQGITFEELAERVSAATAVRRMGDPADIANAVAFFVANESSFVSGQVLYVSGGPSV